MLSWVHDTYSILLLLLSGDLGLSKHQVDLPNDIRFAQLFALGKITGARSFRVTIYPPLLCPRSKAFPAQFQPSCRRSKTSSTSQLGRTNCLHPPNPSRSLPLSPPLHRPASYSSIVMSDMVYHAVVPPFLSDFADHPSPLHGLFFVAMGQPCLELQGYTYIIRILGCQKAGQGGTGSAGCATTNGP